MTLTDALLEAFETGTVVGLGSNSLRRKAADKMMILYAK